MKVIFILLAGLLSVSCQKKPPIWVEVHSASIEREDDEIVCRVFFVNPKGGESELIRMSTASAISSEAVLNRLILPSGQPGRKGVPVAIVKGDQPCETVLRFDGDSISDDEDLSQGKLDLTFLSYSFDSGKWQDFETPLHFEITFDPPESGEE